MTCVIAISTQKGVVGKTTSTVNLADAFVRRGRKVLVVDMDPQGHTTRALTTVEARALRYTTSELMLETDLVVSAACIRQSRIAGLDLVASSIRLAQTAATSLAWRNSTGLSNRLKKLVGNYDIVLLDCPSDLGCLTRNALCAATHYLVPLKGNDIYSLNGLDDLEITIREARDDNSELVQLGMFFNMFDGRTNISNSVMKEAKGRFGSTLLSSYLPDASVFKEAGASNKTVLETARDGSAARAVVELADEILARLPTTVAA